MDLNYLKKLIKVFEESELSDLKIEEEGLKVELSNSLKHQDMHRIIQMPSGFAHSSSIVNHEHKPAPFHPGSAVQESVQIASAEPETSHKIYSPIVGTFYRSPSPDSAPFVEVGSHVNVGQALCIIEAMKLMNEIESDVAGIVEKIILQNAQPVEYNQPLFIIKPD